MTADQPRQDDKSEHTYERDPFYPPDPPPKSPPPDGADDNAGDGGSMSMIEHLEDLRRVLIYCLVAALLATVVCWFFSGRLLDLLVVPLKDQGVYFHAPNEAFLTRLKISFVCGLFLVVPFIFYQIYSFVVPGLYERERKVMTPLLVFSTGLFYTGVAFSFLVVTPQVMKFMLGFGTDLMQPLIGIGPYFAFVARLSLAFGVIFELPLVVLFLSVAGLVNPRTLLRAWRFALIIIVVFAAVLTPPDVISQMMMAVPVVLLYISSVLVAIAVTRKQRARREQEEQQEREEYEAELAAARAEAARVRAQTEAARTEAAQEQRKQEQPRQDEPDQEEPDHVEPDQDTQDT